MAVTQKSKLIYIVDDDPTILKIVAMRLDALGYEYRVFLGPEEFLTEVKQKKPDLCIIDLNIGSRNIGLLLIQVLRKTFGTALPLVVLSADALESTIADAIAYGADSYVLKPVRRDTFEEVMSEYLSDEKKQSDHLHTVPSEKRLTKLYMDLQAVALDREGVTFESNALIVKGTHLTLTGPLQEWFGAKKPVKVQVVQNWLIPDTQHFGIYAIFEEPSEEVQESILRALDSID